MTVRPDVRTEPRRRSTHTRRHALRPLGPPQRAADDQHAAAIAEATRIAMERLGAQVGRVSMHSAGHAAAVGAVVPPCCGAPAAQPGGRPLQMREMDEYTERLRRQVRARVCACVRVRVCVCAHACVCALGTSIIRSWARRTSKLRRYAPV